MKYLIWFLFLASMCSIFLGLSLPDSDTIDTQIKAKEIAYSDKLIGFGVLTLFLVVFPLFSYVRWKDKNLKDYMLNQENLDKMREANKS